MDEARARRVLAANRGRTFGYSGWSVQFLSVYVFPSGSRFHGTADLEGFVPGDPNRLGLWDDLSFAGAVRSNPTVLWDPDAPGGGDPMAGPVFPVPRRSVVMVDILGGSDPGRFPHRCPRCGSPAYVGFSSVECSGVCRK